eukprot:978632-Pleurochrysis_carterae.AAC.1
MKFDSSSPVASSATSAADFPGYRVNEMQNPFEYLGSTFSHVNIFVWASETMGKSRALFTMEALGASQLLKEKSTDGRNSGIELPPT